MLQNHTIHSCEEKGAFEAEAEEEEEKQKSGALLLEDRSRLSRFHSNL